MKRKQIVVLGLVLVIISVGILQYNYGGSGESSKNGSINELALIQDTNFDEIPGAAVYVDNGDMETDTDTESVAQVQIFGYFDEARMEREKARSKQKEELKTMAQVSDGVVSASTILTSSEASEALVEIIKRSESESTIETLVKQRAFEDAMVYMSDTGHIDVIVKAESLSAKDVAQISDIVVRHAGVTMDYITVKNVN